jgi:DNA-binding transcriptional ArsR family regulator
MGERKQSDMGPESGSTAREVTARALRHPLRLQILAACHQRDLTPREFADERGTPTATVGYHFRALEKAGYLQVVREEAVRGARRYFYRAKGPGLDDTEGPSQTGLDAQPAASATVLRGFIARCLAAIRGGTLDTRTDSHLTWSSLELDEQGWNELMAELDRMFRLCHEIQAEAEDRLRASGERSIPTTFGLAGFESPVEGISPNPTDRPSS